MWVSICHGISSLSTTNDAHTDLDAPPTRQPTVYDLIANVTHESVAGTTRDKENTTWKVHLRAGGGGGDSEKWFQIQDLIVEETRKEMIFLGESVLQVGGHLLAVKTLTMTRVCASDLGTPYKFRQCQLSREDGCRS